MSEKNIYIKFKLMKPDTEEMYICLKGISRFKKSGRNTEITMFSREVFKIRISIDQFTQMLSTQDDTSVIDQFEVK